MTAVKPLVVKKKSLLRNTIGMIKFSKYTRMDNLVSTTLKKNYITRKAVVTISPVSYSINKDS